MTMIDLLLEVSSYLIHDIHIWHLSLLAILIIIPISIVYIRYEKQHAIKRNDTYMLQTIGFIRSMVISKKNNKNEKYAIEFTVDAIDNDGSLISINVTGNETKQHIEKIKASHFISIQIDPLDVTHVIYEYNLKESIINDALDRLVVLQTDGELSIKKRREFRKNVNSFPAKVMDIQEYIGSTIRIVHLHITVEYIDQYQSHVCTVSMVLPRYMLRCIHPKDECTLLVSKSDPSNALVDFKIDCYDPNH